MTTLYELTDDLVAARHGLDELLLNKVITQETYDDSLSASLDDYGVKASNVISYIKSLNAEAVMYEEEIEKLQKRQKAASKQAEFYNGYLLQQMLKLDQKEAGEGIHTCKIKKGSKRCVIEDDHWVPDRFMTRQVTYSPDKNAIKAAIKAGETIEGAELVAGPSTLKIV